MHASHDLPAFVIGGDDPKLSTRYLAVTISEVS